ncbi:MAG TPA: hypothetical protein VIK13_13525 [Candidatus Limnocylindrales bacterium]
MSPLRGAVACARTLATSSEVRNLLAPMTWGAGEVVGASAGASGGEGLDDEASPF